MEQSKFLVRNANLSDINAIMEIEKQSFAAATVENRETYEKRIARFSDGFLVVTFEGLVVGSLCSELWEFIDNPSIERFKLGHDINDYHDENHSEGYLISISVSPSFRGKRLANLLFESIEKRLKSKYKVQSLLLLVSNEWQNAKAFYERLGFLPIEKFNKFFTGDNGISHNGIVMRKFL